MNVYQVITLMHWEGDWVQGTFLTLSEAYELAVKHIPEQMEDELHIMEYPIGPGKGRSIYMWRQRTRGHWSLERKPT